MKIKKDNNNNSNPLQKVFCKQKFLQPKLIFQAKLLNSKMRNVSSTTMQSHCANWW